MTTTLTLDNVINGLNVGGTLNVSGLGVLAPDQSLGSLTVTAVGLSSAPTETSFTSSVTIQGAYGTLVMQADGSYSYTASSNISFTNTNGYVQDSFVFTAGNSSGAGQATLTITVTPSGVQYVGAAAGSTVTVGNAATVVDASLGNVT
jgi:VCBS repeat-containing protein